MCKYIKFIFLPLDIFFVMDQFVVGEMNINLIRTERNL